MVLIPAGEFWMGDDLDSDHRLTRETLPDFYMYKDLVTVAQYMKFCSETGRKKPAAPDFNPSWKHSDHPIVNVSLYDAWAYCKWAGVRMPTEPEWEKAARGTDGRRFPWGNEWREDKCANGNNSPGGTAPVGKYTDSPYGLSDMAGNVCQLTVTTHTRIYRDRGDPRPDTIVVKGNSWKWNYSFDLFFRSAHRAPLPLDWSDPVIGFRCAADADSK
jgi:formylglycine-generating enzyme required for sulfatase activity